MKPIVLYANKFAIIQTKSEPVLALNLFFLLNIHPCFTSYGIASFTVCPSFPGFTVSILSPVSLSYSSFISNSSASILFGIINSSTSPTFNLF